MEFSPEKCPKCGSQSIKKTSESMLLNGASRAGDLVLDYMDQRYLKGVGRQIVGDVKIADLLELEDVWECCNCGYVWNRHGKVKKSSLASSLHSNSIAHASSNVASSSRVKDTPSITFRDLSVEIKDDKQYGQTQQLLKVFADCLRVPASSLIYNDSISIPDRKKLRDALLKWYNISVSSNISNCDYLTYADLASLIIDESRRKAKEKTTVDVAEEQLNASQSVGSDYAQVEKKDVVSDSVVLDNENEYLEELKECLANGEISDSERRLLNKIRSKLGISEERAAELEQSLLAPQLTEDEQEYLDAFRDAMEDGVISDSERRLLDKIKKYNNISNERAAEIEKNLLQL